MFSMFGQRGTSQIRGLRDQRMSDSSATFSGMWRPLFGVLRLSKVHSVQQDILWPWGTYATLRNLNFTTYLFPELEIYESPKNFYRTRPNLV